MGKKYNNKEKDFEFSYSDEVKKKKNIIRDIIKTEIKTKAKNESQTSLIRSIKDNEITICSGIAGCGKTYLSLSQALRLLKSENTPYKELYLVKSVTVLKEEELGFLKGDKYEKFEPYMMSYYINIDKIIPKSNRLALLSSENIIPLPLAYIRGTTLDNAIIIIDECQNISIDNIKTVLTRIGNNSRIIVIGDENQIDMKRKEDSSLIFLMENFKDMEKIGIIKMNENDINVRNPIITSIVKRFKERLN